ncbi:DUF2330 domain-containing protein [Candidatus Riflebacteria bacterium]
MMLRLVLFFLLYLICPHIPAKTMRPPGHSSYGSGSIQAYIYYENGWEEVILKQNYKGRREDFFFIIPLPVRPEFNRVKKDFFKKMNNYFPVRYFPNLKESSPVRKKTPSPPDLQHRRVVAPEIKLQFEKKEVVGNFEVFTLKAVSTGNLIWWLKRRGFALPLDAEKTFAAYISKGWYFVFARILHSSKKKFTEADYFLPLSFRFKSEKPIFPFRILSLYPGNWRFSAFFNSGGKVEIPFSNTIRKKRDYLKDRITPRKSPEVMRKMMVRPRPPARVLQRVVKLEYTRLLKFPGLLKVFNRQVLENAPAQFKEQYKKWLENGEYLKMDEARIKRLETRQLTNIHGIQKNSLVSLGDSAIKISGEVEPVPVLPENMGAVVAEILKFPNRNKRESLFQSLKAKKLMELKTLKDERDYRKRKILVKVLALKGDHASVAFLISWLSKEEDWTVKDEICAALQKLSGKDYRSFEIEKWEKWLKLKYNRK